MAQFLDQQINLLARNAQQDTGELFDRIQTAYLHDVPQRPIAGGPPLPAGQKPAPKIEAAPQLRGL